MKKGSRIACLALEGPALTDELCDTLVAAADTLFRQKVVVARFEHEGREGSVVIESLSGCIGAIAGPVFKAQYETKGASGIHCVTFMVAENSNHK